jgi:NhaP-type Na+/H+ or K+/H+ antiporter/Trk K+ transport system NAD-binding subunit
MAAAELFAIVAVVIGLAVAAGMLGSHFGVPNFFFFVLAGIIIGPPGLGILHHDAFGEGLAVVVGLGVAIIIFHSGSGITFEMLRGAPRMAYLLATVGTVVTFLGSAAVTYLVLDVSPGIALLIGALLVPTGATVIEPLLEAVPLPNDIAYSLEIEALVTEVTAGILAIAVFYAVTLTQTDPNQFASVFVWHLVSGVLVGGVVAAVVWALFRYPEHAPERAPQHGSQLYLATAIVAFAIAENVAREAGVAATATAGLLLGNADLPYQEHLDDFKEDFMTFVLAFMFVVLASFVEPDWLATVGIEGLLVAIGVIVVVRPLAVFLATARSVLSIREKVFLSTVSPRGVIPAGLATLLAIDIRPVFPEAAATITGTVLLVILATSLIEGLFARRIAEGLGVTIETVVVVGGGRLGMALADRYEKQGERVTIVETDFELVQTARNAGFAVYHGDGTNEAVLRDAGIERASRVVAASDSDETNAEVARLAKSEFNVEMVLARLNRGDNRTMFEDLDVELLTGFQVDIWALEHLVDQSAPDWLTALTGTGGVRTASVTNDQIDMKIIDLDNSLPERSFVVAITRAGETWVPAGDQTVEYGDKVTVLGRADAVTEALAQIDPTFREETM